MGPTFLMDELASSSWYDFPHQARDDDEIRPVPFVRFARTVEVIPSLDLVQSSGEETGRQLWMEHNPGHQFLSAPFWSTGKDSQTINSSCKWHHASTAIQALVRGHLGRSLFSRRRIERFVENLHANRWRRKNQAARRIQCFVRNILARDEMVIKKLIAKMAEVELAKQSELRNIRQWKEEQMRHIRCQVGEEMRGVHHSAPSTHFRLHIVDELREENVWLLAERDELHDEIRIIRQESEQLQLQIEATRKTTTDSRASLLDSSKQNLKLQHLIANYKHLIAQLMDELAECETWCTGEQEIHKRYRKTVEEMIDNIARQQAMESARSKCLSDVVTSCHA